MTTDGGIRASVIIATYNRASYLARCLNGLAELDADATSFEILVIDNRSDDNTRAVVQCFSGEHPQISVRYLYEETQGATVARNRGMSQAHGEIFCFLDDDTIPSAEWLNRMVRPFADPEVGGVGGPAILDFQGQEVPSWLRGDLKGLLSGYGLSYREPTEISRWAEYPFLCNMAIRRAVVEQVGMFRTDLGPTGNGLVVGEESELVDRARRAGWRVMYLPDAPVRHLVSPERLEKEYIYRSGSRLAVTHIYLTWDPRIRAIARWLLSDLLFATRRFCRLLVALLRRNPLWFDDYMRFWMVARRVPLRLRALVRGKESIARPGR